MNASSPYFPLNWLVPQLLLSAQAPNLRATIYRLSSLLSHAVTSGPHHPCLQSLHYLHGCLPVQASQRRSLSPFSSVSLSKPRNNTSNIKSTWYCPMNTATLISHFNIMHIYVFTEDIPVSPPTCWTSVCFKTFGSCVPLLTNQPLASPWQGPVPTGHKAFCIFYHYWQR